MHNVVNAIRQLLTFGRSRNGRIVSRKPLPASILKSFDARGFEKAIGYRPRTWDFFFEALLHRSFLQNMEGGWRSNERLEFLGDAILSFLVAEHLHLHHPTMEEGDLTKVRSRLVNRRILAERARELRISDFLLLSTSAAQSIDQGSESILTDAFEAIIGAVYLDGGLEQARRFVQRTILARPEIIETALTDDNYKSALLEYVQARSLGVPRYVIVKEEGPDHDRRFTVEVMVGNRRYGIGTGKSKKDAEQSAAFQALERIQTSRYKQ
ncbi:MAG: ribonuclease III [Ignavibacteriales bacterium]|nr:ribonuclease III [Ignavibacteriales bacterium]